MSDKTFSRAASLPARIAGALRDTSAGTLAALPVVALTGVLAAAPAAADVTVAFLGDQGTRQGARDVLALIAARDVDLLVSQGDLGYGRGPELWMENTDRALGENFPVLAVVGNHEGEDWPVYKAWLERRVDAVDGLDCTGDIGVKAHCTFRGLSIVQTAAGVHEVPGVLREDGYAGYLAAELASATGAWRVCSWHKPHPDMQIGDKEGGADWDVYAACLAGGGIVATGHEHSYSRTFLMDDFAGKSVVHRDDHLRIEPGRSFAFVSGLGGQEVRPQTRGGDWWASTWSANDGAAPGALFCRFGDVRAECWFEDTAGAVPDRFTLESGFATVEAGLVSADGSDVTGSGADEPDADNDAAGLVGTAETDDTAETFEPEPSDLVADADGEGDSAVPDADATSPSSSESESSVPNLFAAPPPGEDVAEPSGTDGTGEPDRGEEIENDTSSDEPVSSQTGDGATPPPPIRPVIIDDGEPVPTVTLEPDGAPIAASDGGVAGNVGGGGGSGGALLALLVLLGLARAASRRSWGVDVRRSAPFTRRR